MNIPLTKKECLWLADLVKQEKWQADVAFQNNPNRLYKLRSENMAVLANKLGAAIEREMLKERSPAQ